MNITQNDLDRFGVAANPKHNTTIGKAKAIIEWARKCGVPMGELSINFSNSVGGPWVMPILAVSAIQGATIDPAKEYCFVAFAGEGGQNLAIADALLSFYGPWDVIQRLAAEVGLGEIDPLSSDYLTEAVRQAVEAAAPEV